ncbi:hypothetical protein C8Q79DRAFT_207905 [Trametes meyenii]|nr:hypothetical protein C8Q79DRAFT_207905 [Trametes meyenii]
MAIMDPNGENDSIARVWNLLSEVSEHLSQNRASSLHIHSLADGVKAQAIHSQTGFVLRRFNLDKPRDIYEAELERMNAAMSAENQTLLNDNRQLSTLIREYEQTLEKTMERFRIHAHEVQQRELALMRQYESVIVERESEALNEALAVNNVHSESLVRISRLLRAALRKLGGEDIQAYEAYTRAQARATRSGQSSREASGSSEAGPSSITEAGDASTPPPGENSPQEKGKQRDEDTPGGEPLPAFSVDRLLDEEEDPERRVAVAEWSLEREVELARLERENEELRALVNGLLKPNAPVNRPGSTAPAPSNSNPSAPAPAFAPTPQDPPNGSPEERSPEQQQQQQQPNYSTVPRGPQRAPGGAQGNLGPFGTYRAPSSPWSG